MKKRNIAYKVWISQLFNGSFIKQETEFESSYVELDSKKISRVNIIATVVGKFASDDESYISITIDDGSHEIRLKAWREDSKMLTNIRQGDLILVIGRVREYNNEIYITPNIVKVLNEFNWEIARKLELLREYGFIKKNESKKQEITTEPKQEYIEEKIETGIPSSTRTIVLDIINKLSGSDGVYIEEIRKHSGLASEEVNTAINELVKDGEIYKSKAGVVDLV